MSYRACLCIGLASAILVMVSSSTVEASPWTKSAGQYYAKVGQSVYQASSHRRGDGVLVDDISYFSTTSFLYAEVGVFDDVHLQTYLPMAYARASDGQASVSDVGFQDALLSAQASPIDVGTPTSIRFEAKLPLYGLPDPPFAPARGDQQVDLTLWLSAGRGLTQLPLYFYIDAGYRHRTSRTVRENPLPPPDYSDSMVTFATAGYTVAETLDIGLFSSAIIPLSREPFDESYVTVGSSIFFPLNDLVALEADAYMTPYARNSASGWSVAAGVSFRRD